MRWPRPTLSPPIRSASRRPNSSATDSWTRKRLAAVQASPTLRIFAVIAPQGTPPVVATLDYLEEQRVPLLFPFQGSPITRGKKYVFSGMTLYDRQSKMMIDYLVGQRKVKTFAALYQDDEYGKAFLASFEKDLERHKLKLAAAESVKRGVNDVSAQIAKLQAARPQVTFPVLTPPAGAQALISRLS